MIFVVVCLTGQKKQVCYFVILSFLILNLGICRIISLILLTRLLQKQ